ncbi:MAG TPA: hypothetical protein VE377_08015 [Candidatus Dormibacteraeota bacterium]|nr:hypothetical protein [Candidatus Dormibacteraeota bacterium]
MCAFDPNPVSAAIAFLGDFHHSELQPPGAIIFCQVQLSPVPDGTMRPMSVVENGVHFMKSTWSSGVSVVVVLAAISFAISCGGSSGGSTTPPGRGVAAQIVVISGDQQSGVPGETLPAPLDVQVIDSFGLAVPNVTVSFAINGGQTFPQAVQTADTGHARALVRLPNTAFTTVNITASSASLTANFTATTGPRLLATFGNVSAAHGAVRPDGSYVGVSQITDFLPGLGYDFFAPDGSLSQRLGPLQGKMGLPGLYDSFWSVVPTPNQNLYFRSVTSFGSEYVVGLDDGLNLVQFTDLARSNGVSASKLTGAMAVDNTGNVYIAQGDTGGTVYGFDANGNNTNKISIQANAAGIAVSHAGNLVTLVPSSSGYSFKEYSMAGTLVHTPSTPAFSSLVTFAQDPDGNYLVLDNVSPLYKFDQNYNVLSTVNLSPPPFGSAQAAISGADASGNLYISSPQGTGVFKYDPSGILLAATAWPIQYVCSGCPSPSYTDEMVSPTGIAIDPVTSDVYVSDNGRTVQMTSAVLRFTNQKFAQRLSLPQAYFASDVAIGSAREIYVADLANNNVHVLDMEGNELRTLSSSTVGIPYSIAIDINDNKYIYDTSNDSIRILDSSDTLVATLPLNLPGLATGYVRVGSDDNLMLTLWLNGSRMVEELATDGTVLFSTTYPASGFVAGWATTDTRGNMFVAGEGQTKVLNPSGSELGSFKPGLTLPPACGIASNGDTIYVCYLNRISALSVN